MSPEDGPPPLDDFDEDGPPPLDEFEEAERKPKQSDGSLLGLEEKIDSPWAAPKPESSSAAHDALITKLQAKPKEKKEKKQKEQEAPAASFVVGDTVEIHGLTGAAQHNGKTGVVKSFDEAKGRYAVALTTGGKKPLAIKPANLAKHKPLPKGFFDSAAAKKGGKKNGGKRREPEPEPEDDIIEIVTPKFKEAQQKSDLQLDEVQRAMKAANAKQSEWMNDDFMSRFSKNPRLMKGFQDPRCQKAMEEMQSDPKGASAKYANDPEIKEFLREFMGLMGDQFGNLADEQDKKEKEKIAAKAAAAGPMADPQVQAIMSDPEFMPILQQCQRPGYFTRYMQDPRYAPRLQLLLDKGVFNLNS